MSKELEALNYLVNLAVVGNKENNRGKVFTSEEIILKAIKRNEPMKVLVAKHYVGFGYFKCPKCGVTISPLKIAEARYNYCPDCGKALDWSEEK